LACAESFCNLILSHTEHFDHSAYRFCLIKHIHINVLLFYFLINFNIKKEQRLSQKVQGVLKKRKNQQDFLPLHCIKKAIGPEVEHPIA
jgi:hypothetical protein